jgi:hypothetical protein
LSQELGPRTSEEPPLQIGMRLEAQRDMAEIFDITGLTSLPGGQRTG